MAGKKREEAWGRRTAPRRFSTTENVEGLRQTRVRRRVVTTRTQSGNDNKGSSNEPGGREALTDSDGTSIIRLTERLSRPEFSEIAAMATTLSTRREDDPKQAKQPDLGGSASAEMKQGLRTYHSTAGGLRHRKNLRGEATIQLRSRKEKWDVRIHLEQCG